MQIDLNVVRARFSGMTRDELLEEVALRLEEYTPPAQRILEGEAQARGIGAAQIQERRNAAAAALAPEEADGIDLPALITSSSEKGHVQELVQLLREHGIPGVVRELDPKAFHASGHRVGRWGLMVPGLRAADAARIVADAFPAADEEDDAAGCGGGCCAASGACDPSGEEWDEDGDWWKTSGEEDPDGERP